MRHEERILTDMPKQPIAGTYHDITDRRQPPEDRNQLRYVADNLPVLITHVDSGERITFANKTAGSWYGRPTQELVGEAIGAISGEMAYREIQPHINAAISGEYVHFNQRIRSVDGDERIVDMAYSPDFGGNGSVIGFWALGTDITERKSLEEQLRMAQKSEALGALTMGIAHDLGNCLSLTLGHAWLMREQSKAYGGNNRRLNTIIDAAQRARDLILQIQNFGKQEKPGKQVGDLTSVAKEALSLVRSAFPNSIVIQELISSEVLPVIYNASQVHQVLVNLLVNAGHAMANSGRLNFFLDTVELNGVACAGGKTLSGEHVRLAVSDSGHGMDEKTLVRIFDPFFTTRGEEEGTGLGLSTVMAIVDDHNGGIVVTSQLGKGTVFEVFLPVSGHRMEASGPTQRQSPHGDESILFVDDEQDIVAMAKESLEGCGFEVAGFSDSSLALRHFLADPHRFDLVVTDQIMPQIHGTRLAAEIRKSRPEIPIILCTGGGLASTAASCRSVGIDSVLHKPFAPDELGWEIRKLLDQGMGQPPEEIISAQVE